MRVSREQAAESRERILDTAARVFREKGFDGIGLADLMKQAGLTHGAFYGHFSSKEDLMAQASARAGTAAVAEMRHMVERSPDEKPLTAIARSYLSERHRANPGAGCVIAALGGDVARQGESVRQGARAGVEANIDFLASVAPGRNVASRREKAINQYATMVGALVLARVAEGTELSDEILQTVIASLSGTSAASK
ncbi:TetR/AcrR family transcriptional regulator [Chitinimonas naiadis]